MQHKYYLFDFDGTLVDSMPTFCSCMLRILDENHITYEKDIVKIITPLGLNGTAEYFINKLGLVMEKDALLSKMKDYMMDAYFHTISAKVNVTAVLAALKERGASLNILTASPHITLDACLKRLGLWELFDNIWSCDDFGTTTADPRIYVMAAEKMGATVENILFLDDNLNADAVAKSAGMLVCGVYDDSSKDYVEEMKSTADFYIYDFAELLDLETEKKY
jgi:HAD superfamily hydrolase (TIGR01509 family)